MIYRTSTENDKHQQYPHEYQGVNHHRYELPKNNVKALHLEERYERHKATAHKYLLLRQQYDDTKVEEMVKMGMFPTKDFAYRVLYGEPLDEEAEEGILRKLRRDIAGRG